QLDGVPRPRRGGLRGGMPRPGRRPLGALRPHPRPAGARPPRARRGSAHGRAAGGELPRPVRGAPHLTAPASRFDRSLVEGPLRRAVWRLAWPTVLTNVVGGLQGIVDHVMVGHMVGYRANAAIGVSWQVIIIVIVFITSLFTGMSVLVSRFTGAGEEHKVDRTVYQAFLTA